MPSASPLERIDRPLQRRSRVRERNDEGRDPRREQHDHRRPKRPPPRWEWGSSRRDRHGADTDDKRL
jgi:hypothetical protein